MVRGAAVVALGATAVVTVKLIRRFAAQAKYVDINTADHETLQLISHIGPGRATRIIELRAAKPFKSVEEMEARVPGIGPASLAHMLEQGLACVGSQPSSA
jgi:DNA uptake protein ComE-like DNA-binding protein